MKKIKISELPLYSSLKGLYTLGTDKDNRSVKVSLEFIGEQTSEAVADAAAATEAAVKAAQDADKATAQAQAATTAANNAATAATTAKGEAETATSNANANAATAAAQRATSAAEDATRLAAEATEAAEQATENANIATGAAENATSAAIYAAERVLTLIGSLVPSALAVEAVPRLTVGNVQPVYIKATLTPDNCARNIIYISDGKAVTVSPDGRLSIVGVGRSTVQVIPTVNTSLAKVIQVEVGEPTLRLASRQSLRLTSSGALRLN